MALPLQLRGDMTTHEMLVPGTKENAYLLQWPTLVTLAMFPVLLVTYVRLGHREEREVKAAFGDAWRAYAAVTPAGSRSSARGAPPTAVEVTPSGRFEPLRRA